jgi:hypothetical protein
MRDLHIKVNQCSKLNNTESRECAEYEYLLAIKSQYSRVRQSKPKNLVADVNSVPANGKFSQIFADYILKDKPLIGVLPAGTGAESCIREAMQYAERWYNFVTEDISLQNCSARGHLVVPSVIRNNFLFRLPAAPLDINSDVERVNYVSQWPALFALTPGTPTTVQQCPLGLHQLIVNTADNIIKVRLFSSTAMSAFDPVMGDEDHDVEVLPLHHLRFKLSGFPKLHPANINKKSFSLPKFHDVTLKTNEYLLITSGILASYLLEASSVPVTDNAFVMRYCFVDASNVNIFRQRLMATARLSDFNQRVLHHLDNNTIVSMDINPTDTQMDAALQQQPEHPLPPQSTDDANPPPTSQLPPRQRNPRRRTTSDVNDGSFDQKKSDSSLGWQDVVRWNSLTQSLTLQAPTQLRLRSSARNNVTLSFQTTFMRDRKDATAFGFEARVCHEDIPVDVSSEFDDVGCNTTLLSLGGPLLAEGEGTGDDSQRDFTSYTAVIPQLQQGSFYRVRLVMVLGDFRSRPSEWSHLFCTANVSAPSIVPGVKQIKLLFSQTQSATSQTAGGKSRKLKVSNPFLDSGCSVLASQDSGNSVTAASLTFVKPFDDGGESILGYIARGRFSDPDTDGFDDTAWATYETETFPASPDDTSKVTVGVLHSLGNVSVEFQVAAFNSVGLADWSEASNLVRTTSVLSRNSRKIQYFVRDRNAAEALVTADAVQQVLSVSSRNHTAQVDGWSCHWGTEAVSTGTVKWAVPSMADSDLMNAGSLLGSIVFVLRGSVPFVHKVLRVQVRLAFFDTTQM